MDHFLNQARAHSWPRAWFTEMFRKSVCVCTYLPTYLCLSVRTHVSKNH